MKPIMSKPKYAVRDIANLKDMLEQTVALYSDKDAFIKKVKNIDIGISYKKYKEDVFGLGTEIEKLGISNERVAILSENRYEWCVSFMAITVSNGIAVPVSTKFDENELVSKLNLVGAKCIIFSEKYRELIKNIKKKCPDLNYFIDMDTIIDDNESLSLLRLMDSGNKNIQNGNNDLLKLKIDNESGAAIFLEDTIIKDKPVLLSHKNLVSNITNIISFMPIISDDKTIIMGELSKSFICICSFLIIIAQGGTICFNNEEVTLNDNLIERSPSVLFVTKDCFWDIYRRIWSNLGDMPSIRKVRLLMILSTILLKFNIDLRKKFFNNILKNLGNNIKFIAVEGKSFKNRILRDFYTFGLNVVECYSIPEASSIIMVNGKYDFMKENAAGFPLPNLSVNIELNGIKSSKIMLKSDTVMLGYYNDKKATDKVIKNGTLYIGKCGYKDKNGCFYFQKDKKNKEVK